MNFEQTLAQDRRLAMLRILLEVNGEANESVLCSGLESIGHSRMLTRENVRGDLRFLETAGAIRLSWFDGRIAVAHLLIRGEEIAKGKIVVEGIKRPSIGD